MASSLVYPAHPFFEPYRELARTSELNVQNYAGGVRLEHDPISVPPSVARCLGNMFVEYMDQQELDMMFWSRFGGLNTLSQTKRWPNNIVNTGLRLEFDPTQPYRSPTSFELVGFGAGTLRPRKPELPPFVAVASQIETGLQPHCYRIDSKLRGKAAATYLVKEFDVNEKRDISIAYESVGLVMPEIYAELEQLAARTHDNHLIDTYLAHLLRKCSLQLIEFHAFEDGMPTALEGRLHAPAELQYREFSWAAAHLGHLSNGIFKELPSTTYELRDRVERLLHDIVVDNNPVLRALKA